MDVVRWWERRRLRYNVIVGLTGVASTAILAVCGFTANVLMGRELFGLPDGPLLGVFAVICYGVMANVCYTGGWLVELGVRASGGDPDGQFGARAFRRGLAFSIALTALPAVYGVGLLAYGAYWAIAGGNGFRS